MKTVKPVESKWGLLDFSFGLRHVALPLGLGALVYTLWRVPSLLVFEWYETLGLGDGVAALRGVAQPAFTKLPTWFLYCLPDGLWVYACTAFMAALWARAESGFSEGESPTANGVANGFSNGFDTRLANQSALWPACFWIGLAPTLAIGAELGQKIHRVQGTYHTLDIVFYVAGFLLALGAVYHKQKSSGAIATDNGYR